MNIGFTVVNRGDAVAIRFTGKPGAGPLALLSFACRDRRAVVVLGRLYYRAELTGRLPETLDLESASEAELALAVFRHEGVAGLERLEGDFALVAWDGRERRLYAMRDPMGGYPLYWTEAEGTFALSTQMEALLDLRPTRTLNVDYLAEFLMLPSPTFHEVPSEQCAYEGIRRVRGGVILSRRYPDGTVDLRRYWNWFERRIDPGTDDLDALSEQFGARFRLAVRERCRGRVAAHLSGGMDSTAVALVAHQLAGREDNPVHALTLDFERLAYLARERPYADCALATPGIVAHHVNGDDLLAYSAFSPVPHFEEPSTAMVVAGAQLGALADAAAGAGADTLLTGLGADEMLTPLPFDLTGLLRRGRFLSAWRQAAHWGATYQTSTWQFFLEYGVRNLLPCWLRMGLWPLVRGGYASWQRQGPWTIAPWIRPSFARRYGLRGRALANLRWMYRSGPSPVLSQALAEITANQGDNYRWYLAAPRGIAQAHPFQDTRLVRWGLGIRGRYRAEPGEQKPILGRAMREVLPAVIRQRRGKGHFNEVYFLGLSRNLPRLEAMIRKLPPVAAELFDSQELLHCLRMAALGVSGDAMAVGRLDLTLTLVHWLVSQPRRPATVPTTSVVFDGKTAELAGVA
jgi:asparagine synthase (glutamine-hydrolysing)